jgi:addiction module HigA family antidote
MDDYQLNPVRLAKAISMSPSAIRQIVIGKTGITVPVALRLAKHFGTTPDYWINVQRSKDLAEAGKDDRLSAVIKSIPTAKKPLAENKVKKDTSASNKKNGTEKPKKKQVKKARKPRTSKKG